MDEMKKKDAIEANILENCEYFLASHRIIMKKMMAEEPGIAALAVPNLLRLESCINSLEQLTQVSHPKTAEELKKHIPKELNDIVEKNFDLKYGTKLPNEIKSCQKGIKNPCLIK